MSSTSKPICLTDKKKVMDSSNKAFFNNIKAELSSIRTDVNKFVANKDSQPKSLGFNKSVSSSFASKDPLALEKRSEQKTEECPEEFKKLTEKINQLTTKYNKKVNENEMISQ